MGNVLLWNIVLQRVFPSMGNSLKVCVRCWLIKTGILSGTQRTFQIVVTIVSNPLARVNQKNFHSKTNNFNRHIIISLYHKYYMLYSHSFVKFTTNIAKVLIKTINGLTVSSSG